MKIYTEDYRICYDPATATVSFVGSLGLSGPVEYDRIAKLLGDVGGLQISKITLKVQKLEFTNSSGINMLSELAIEMCKISGMQMTVQGFQFIPWQGKSLKNLQWLIPA